MKLTKFDSEAYKARLFNGSQSYKKHIRHASLPTDDYVNSSNDNPAFWLNRKELNLDLNSTDAT